MRAKSFRNSLIYKILYENKEKIIQFSKNYTPKNFWTEIIHEKIIHQGKTLEKTMVDEKNTDYNVIKGRPHSRAMDAPRNSSPWSIEKISSSEKAQNSPQHIL